MVVLITSVIWYCLHNYQLIGSCVFICSYYEHNVVNNVIMNVLPCLVDTLLINKA